MVPGCGGHVAPHVQPWRDRGSRVPLMQFMSRGDTATLTHDGMVEASSFAEAVEKPRQARPDLDLHVVEGDAAEGLDSFAVFRMEPIDGDPNRLSPKLAGTVIAGPARKH